MARPYATLMKIAANKLAQFRMATTLRDPMRSRIGMFHDIVPDDAPLPDEYACHISDLRRIVEAHIARGFRFVPLSALLTMPDKQAEYGCCALTFDDGFAGVATLAAPYLSERGIPFTLYITTGYLDTAGYLSTDALRALSQNPLVSVGSHLCTHPMTRFLPRKAVQYELFESKRILEDILDKPVSDLAFPYGSAYACSLRDLRLAKRAGYRSAALTTPTALSRRWPNGNYSLPRMNMFM